MNYDAAAARRLGADPKSWRWFTANYDKYQPVESDLNSLRRVEKTRINPGRFTLSLLALILVFGMVTVIALSRGTGLLPDLLVCATFLVTGALCHARPIALKIVSYSLLAMVAFFATTHLYLQAPLSPSVAFQFALYSWGIGLLLKGSFRRTTKTAKAAGRVTRDGVTRTFGTPGGVADAAGKFGQEAVDAGVKGEQNTAALLDLLMKIPGTTVFHGLRFPGSAKADVDHAVVHGGLVYLIDSKMYRWGEYEWKRGDKGDEIVRSDGYGRGKPNHMDTAAEGYRRILGPDVSVVPLIIIHGRNVTIANSGTSRNGVMMLTADDAMRYIGDNFHKRMLGWKDNPEVRSVLLQNLK